jgi:hypothetical protein
VGAAPWREGMGGGTRDDDEATDWLGASDRVGSAGTLNVSFPRLDPAPAVDGGFESTIVFGVSAVSDWTLMLGASVDT